MKPSNIIPIHSDKNPRADAIRNRRLLLDTALRLFQEHGVEAVTMSAIAKEADVGKGTLYRHFTDKSDLCHALLDEDMREFQVQTLSYIRQNHDALVSLRWFVEKTAHYVIDHSELLLEAAHHSNADLLMGHPAHIWWRQTIVGLMARLDISGDSSYIADILYVMLDVQTIRFQRRGLGYDVQRIIDGLMMSIDRLIQVAE
jgi:AcrR family transcriptional regulator